MRLKVLKHTSPDTFHLILTGTYTVLPLEAFQIVLITFQATLDTFQKQVR